MSMTTPTGWVKYSVTENAVTFRRPNHTGSHTDVVIFKRIPGSNGQNTFIVKHVLASVTEGETRNSIAELNVRTISGTTYADQASYFGELAALLGDANFLNDLCVDLDLPIDN